MDLEIDMDMMTGRKNERYILLLIKRLPCECEHFRVIFGVI
jgi:hypothetical protein